MKFKLSTIIRIVTLLTSVVALVMVLKKPAPVAQPQTPAAVAANAQSFGEKMEQFSQAAQQPAPASRGSYQTAASQEQGSLSSLPKAEVHLNSQEVGAALAQATQAGGSAELTPDTNMGSGAPTIKEQQVSFEGDVVHGQFLAEVAGKDVWVTVSGHLGSKDGYATFEPTEFKVGEMNVPVSMVNSALQKKLFEQHDRLKLPDYVGDMKVQNGELIMQQK
ncbi:MAG: hypothetical protein JWQ87_4055 [Candidatus Sulfotelmatobacter sp.]|nr:hypothetical protein [Candidatus Sulfotelmatobacter sp.]